MAAAMRVTLASSSTWRCLTSKASWHATMPPTESYAMNAVCATVAIFFLTLSGSAFAATSECVAIKDSTKRLKCYDSAQKNDGAGAALKGKQNAAAESALKALRKLRSAAQMGVSLRDYGQLIMEQITSVDEDLISIPNGELKSAIEQSKLAYIDAKDVWSGMINAQYINVFVSVYKPNYSKYDIDPKYSALLDSAGSARSTDINKSYILGPIWAAGAKSLEQAEHILAAQK